jgi:tetratricopeptide (TPR) repeat protein
MGRTDDAVKYYQKALELSPNNASAYYELGIVYFKTGKNAEAMACFQKAMDLAPGTDVAASAEKYFELLK